MEQSILDMGSPKGKRLWHALQEWGHFWLNLEHWADWQVTQCLRKLQLEHCELFGTLSLLWIWYLIITFMLSLIDKLKNKVYLFLNFMGENLRSKKLWKGWQSDGYQFLLPLIHEQVGNHIDVSTGKWTALDSGIGGGIDSYFEYLVKGSIMFDIPELLEHFRGI
jgi:hypothetical protein